MSREHFLRASLGMQKHAWLGNRNCAMVAIILLLQVIPAAARAHRSLSSRIRLPHFLLPPRTLPAPVCPVARPEAALGRWARQTSYLSALLRGMPSTIRPA